MADPYSQPLRDRVARAVSSECSARAAAARFSVSTAIRWVKRLVGGDHRSRLSDHRAVVRTRCWPTKPDLTLEEIGPEKCARRGVSVSLGTVWRFLKAQTLTLKKAYTPPSSSVMTSSRPGAPSSVVNRPSIPSAWCCSTKPEPAPTYPGATAGLPVACASWPPSRTGTGRQPH